MLDELYRLFRDDLREGSAEQVDNQLNTNNDILVFDKKTGVVNRFEQPAEKRDHTIGSIQSLVDIAERYEAKPGTEDTKPTPSIYVSLNKAVAVFNDDRGCYVHRATMALKPSNLFIEITKLDGLKPKFLNKKLRHTFASATFDPVDLIQIFGKVNFKTHSDEDQNHEVADVGVSKKIVGKVTGTGAIPEQVLVRFAGYPAIREFDTPVEIKCSVFTDAFEGTISILPQPGEIEAAKQMIVSNVVDHLAGELSKTGYSVFNGIH